MSQNRQKTWVCFHVAFGFGFKIGPALFGDGTANGFRLTNQDTDTTLNNDAAGLVCLPCCDWAGLFVYPAVIGVGLVA